MVELIIKLYQKITKVYPELIDRDIHDIIRANNNNSNVVLEKLAQLDEAIEKKMDELRLTELSRELDLRK